jgi:hypothetical protein
MPTCLSPNPDDPTYDADDESPRPLSIRARPSHGIRPRSVTFSDPLVSQIASYNPKVAPSPGLESVRARACSRLTPSRLGAEARAASRASLERFQTGCWGYWERGTKKARSRGSGSSRKSSRVRTGVGKGGRAPSLAGSWASYGRAKEGCGGCFVRRGEREVTEGTDGRVSRMDIRDDKELISAAEPDSACVENGASCERGWAEFGG